MLTTHNELTIYFGDAQDLLYPHNYLTLSKEKNILEKNPFSKLKKSLNITQLLFLKQVHSTEGLIISNEHNNISSFFYEGDFLITNLSGIGLGAMAADCLPIIMHDPIANVCAIVHAGWKGTLNNIASKVAYKMQELFTTDLSALQIFFGPSAKKCCYAVKEDFVSQVRKNPLIDSEKVFHQKNNALFFDLPRCNRLLLEKIGIQKNAFHLNYNACTICNSQYFSHRRQDKQAGRQMTVISLQ